jgi:hypothetical protein
MILLESDIEFPNSVYIWEEEDGLWYGHKRSYFVEVIGCARPQHIQFKLTKIASKMGYKLVTTKKKDTANKIETGSVRTKKRASPKKKSGSFVSLF